MNGKVPELLAPAGSFDSLRAAVESGADAVYFGTSSFNARMMAKNISDGELDEAIGYCHSNGVRCYVTMNTALGDRQLDGALRQAETLYLKGADALIVADLGLASLLHEYLPDFHLHASTQASGHNTAAAAYLAAMGFSRMVCARELSRENIATLCKDSPIEIEMFVHGALCVSQSGQCLLSSFIGGRSGNRGECAQPCRMTYNGSYPLSLKDLCLAGHVTEILSLGVSSLKIEGRMKSPDYVKAVVSVWRGLIDGRRNAEKSEIDYLAGVFSRGGFTDGYFTGRIGGDMLGVRSDADKNRTKSIKRMSRPVEKKLPVSVPERTYRLPTRIEVKSPKIDFRPLSTARFYDPETLPEKHNFDIIYVPLEKYDGRTAEKCDGVLMPPVIPDGERRRVSEALANAKALGAKHILVGNIGHMALAKESGLEIHGDYRLNICSQASVSVYGACELILSPELTLPQIRDITAAKSIIIYGRQPLMTLEKQVGAKRLVDRRKAVFPIIREGNRDILLNSAVTYMGDRRSELSKLGKCGTHMIFTVETAEQVRKIIAAYSDGASPKGDIRRIK